MASCGGGNNRRAAPGRTGNPAALPAATPRTLTRAADLFVGETLYGALAAGGVLPPFGAAVVKVS